MIEPDAVAREFSRVYGRAPRLFRAPGRVNLIGEHTDYNDGFVMPMAIDRSTWVAAAVRDDRSINVRSSDFQDAVTLDMEREGFNRANPAGRHWSDFVRGMASVLDGGPGAPIAGADLLISTDVPIGAGLSSSAALEISVGYSLSIVSGRAIDLMALALAGQRAEHEYVGTRCGVMDQMAACYGRAGTLMKLDTRTLEVEWVPFPARLRAIVCNTMVTHELASAAYNARRADCEEGVRILSAVFPDVHALRDVTLQMLDSARGELSDRVYRRCRHVIGENARVEQTADALSANDFWRAGRLMGQSHRSLRDDYEVSCEELDTMAGIVESIDGIYGARMTGGGFGGSVVGIADAAADPDRIAALVRQQYEERTGRKPDVWWCVPSDGVSEWS